MKPVDQYLQSALEARAEAEKAGTQKERVGWEEIARNWLTLASLQPLTDGAFEKEVAERGTGQDVSTDPQ